MKHSYGYILGTEDKSNDEDHVDVFLGDQPESEIVFVVNQLDPETKKFDEVKVMMGFVTEEAAKAGYLANYDADWQGLGEIRAMTMPDFKEWLADAATKQAEEAKSSKRPEHPPTVDFGPVSQPQLEPAAVDRQESRRQPAASPRSRPGDGPAR